MKLFLYHLHTLMINLRCGTTLHACMVMHYSGSKLDFWKIDSDNQKLYGWRYRKFIELILCKIRFYNFFILCTFFVKLTVFEILSFFEFLGIFFWNWNKMIMVEDTLNLMAHFIREIKFYTSFVSSTFLIRLTVYEILRVFWKMTFENMQAICTTGLIWIREIL